MQKSFGFSLFYAEVKGFFVFFLACVVMYFFEYTSLLERHRFKTVRQSSEQKVSLQQMKVKEAFLSEGMLIL